VRSRLVLTAVAARDKAGNATTKKLALKLKAPKRR